MEGYIGEIRMFAATFAPRTWAYCQGQTLSIAQNTALFSILGTTYGGNGQTTFALPDFRGRVAVGTGQGPGLSNVYLGEMAGSPSVTLNQSNLPSHNHTLSGNSHNIPVTGTIKATMHVNNAAGDLPNPKGNYLGVEGGSNGLYASTSNNTLNSNAIQVGASSLGVSLASISIGFSGGNLPIDNSMPSLGINYIICMYGIFPSRN